MEDSVAPRASSPSFKGYAWDPTSPVKSRVTQQNWPSQVADLEQQNGAGPKALGLRLACYTTVGNIPAPLFPFFFFFLIFAYSAALGLSCARRDL